jgi:hypothetical protein
MTILLVMAIVAMAVMLVVQQNPALAERCRQACPSVTGGGGGGGGRPAPPGRRGQSSALAAESDESSLTGGVSRHDDDAIELARVMSASAAEAGQTLSVEQALTELHEQTRPSRPTGRFSSGAAVSNPRTHGSRSAGRGRGGLVLGNKPPSTPARPSQQSAVIAAATAASSSDPFADPAGDSWDIDFDMDEEAPPSSATELQSASDAVATGGTLPDVAAPPSTGLGRIGQVKFTKKPDDDGFDDDW